MFAAVLLFLVSKLSTREPSRGVVSGRACPASRGPRAAAAAAVKCVNFLLPGAPAEAPALPHVLPPDAHAAVCFVLFPGEQRREVAGRTSLEDVLPSSGAWRGGQRM